MVLAIIPRCVSKHKWLTRLEKVGAGVIGRGGDICREEFGPFDKGVKEGVSNLDMVSSPGLGATKSWRQHFD